MSDGYVAFVVSILLIGVLTALIGDLASHMGCTVGLKDTVTAVAFVALGTSIPGIYTTCDWPEVVWTVLPRLMMMHDMNCCLETLD